MNLAPQIHLSCAAHSYSNGVRGVFQTVAIMRDMVKRFKINLDIRQAAISTIYLTPEKNENREAAALFYFVRDSVRYVKDIAGVETISTPDKTLLMRIGDCDDQSTLLSSLLESVGYPTRFIVAGYYDSSTLEHVYLQVLCGSDWIDCDPTENHGFGWSPPNPTIIYVENI